MVDNEEDDRRLLIDRLAPLGFELWQAASGEAALALLARQTVHAVFLDLAMPGIDGWTTLRRLRAAGQPDLPAAIVSANAFDQGLDNDLGIAPADFLVKPVRMAELQAWLQRRLGLQWREVHAPAEPGLPAPPSAHLPPPRAALLALDELVRLGYLRGIPIKLDAVARQHPASAAFVQDLRALASAFQLDALAQRIQAALAESPVAEAEHTQHRRAARDHDNAVLAQAGARARAVALPVGPGQRGAPCRPGPTSCCWVSRRWRWSPGAGAAD